MHFVVGGAYNGKANWVKKYYNLESLTKQSYEWLSAYDGIPLPQNLSHIQKKIIILEGIERWTLRKVETNNVDESRNKLQMNIQQWLDWAKQLDHQLVIIGTDISKGIVPIDKKLRMWRDLTGFIYQYIVQNCTTFHHIWYGVAQQLK